MRPVHLAALTTALAALLAVGLAPAWGTNLGGADGVRYAKDVTTIAADGGTATVGEAEAVCDTGWTAVGGGTTVKTPGDRGIAASTTFETSRWYSRGWQVSGQSSPVTSWATCLKNPPVTTTAESIVQPPGPALVTASMLCQDGVAVSGSVFGNGNPANFMLTESYPIDFKDVDTTPDDGWRAWARYTGPGTGDTFSVRTTCYTGSLAYRKTAFATVSAGTSKTVKRACPRGREVLAGGVETTGEAAQSRVMSTRPYDSSDAGTVPEDGWSATVQNTSGTPVTMRTHAVCR